MQGIAKHRYAASAFYEGVCRVSVRLNAGHGADALCRERNRTATKSNAASIWQRVFVESLLAQFSVRQVIAEQGTVVHGKQKQSGKPLATVVYRSVFTSVHSIASNRYASHGTAPRRKAKRPATWQQVAVRSVFTSQQGAVLLSRAMQGIEVQSNAASHSRRVVRVVFDSAQNTAGHGADMQGRANKSNAARPFNEWLCRGAFLSRHGSAQQCSAT
jgi:hypothetical protein